MVEEDRKVVAFKTPFDALQHCTSELDAWHPQWHAALKQGDFALLSSLSERYRHRILAVFPRAQYLGSWAMAASGFGYRLYELSEFGRASELLSEARTIYGEALPHCTSERNRMQRALSLHCLAEILLRSYEIDGDVAHLQSGRELCIAAAGLHPPEAYRFQATIGAIHRRLAEHDYDEEKVAAAMEALTRAGNVTMNLGGLSWALQRRTVASVLLLRRQTSSRTGDLAAAKIAVSEAISYYTTNPHNLWIRPSSLDDALAIQARIEIAINDG